MPFTIEQRSKLNKSTVGTGVFGALNLQTLLPPNHSTAGSAQLGVRLALTESSGLTGLKTMLRMR